MADLIDDLLSLDDTALQAKLGFTDRLKVFKADLDKAAKLTGEPRKQVLKHLDRMFTPDNWEVQDLGHTIDRAAKKAEGKTTPDEIVGCCCGDMD